MKDYLVKALGFGGEVRVIAANTTQLCNVANHNVKAYPTGAAALGRTLTATAMIGSMLKGKETVTVRINGNGPIGSIIADANAFGKVRGYASNPRVQFQYPNGKLNVGMAVGTDGDLFVTKDLGLKDYFTGQVPLQTGEIGDDFTYYFTQSEQTPSAVGLGVLVDEDSEVIAAGGFILQLMPGASEETIVELEKALQTIKPVSDMINDGMTPEDMVFELVGEKETKILETLPLLFECKCNKDKFYTGLASLGNNELQQMIDDDQGAEAMCHFCMKKYHFTVEELEKMKSS